MTVVKSVSDGVRDCEIETQLDLNQPLRMSPGPWQPEPAPITGLIWGHPGPGP